MRVIKNISDMKMGDVLVGTAADADALCVVVSCNMYNSAANTFTLVTVRDGEQVTVKIEVGERRRVVVVPDDVTLTPAQLVADRLLAGVIEFEKQTTVLFHERFGERVTPEDYAAENPFAADLVALREFLAPLRPVEVAPPSYDELVATLRRMDAGIVCDDLPALLARVPK